MTRLVLTGILAVCLTGQTPAPPGYSFAISYTGNTLGRIEHCLCNGQELGGFAERSKLIEDIRAKETGRVLLFDTGDIIDKKDPVILENALKIMRTDGYSFAALGEKDLQVLPSEMQAIRNKVNLTLLLTNASPQVFIEPSVTDFIGGLRIQFFNVVNWVGTPPDWYITDSAAAIQDALDHSTGPADFRVLISHLDTAQTRQLADQFAGRIHIVIESHAGYGVPQYVTDYTRVAGTDPCEQVNRLIADYTVTPPFFSYRVFAAAAKAEVNPKVLGDIAKMRPKGKPPEGGSTPRTGSGVCASCHAAEAEQWKQTAHAMVVDTVYPAAKPDSKCVACHAPLAEVDERAVGCESCHGGGASHVISAYTQKVNASATIPAFGKMTVEVCASCHTPDGKHIKAFDLKAVWPKIAHKPGIEAPETTPTAPPPT
ncbi:MAG: multiheme c-type cytochrome, partial [bacterium]